MRTLRSASGSTRRFRNPRRTAGWKRRWPPARGEATSPSGQAEANNSAHHHPAKRRDRVLQQWPRLVAEMGGLAQRMIVEPVDPLRRRDVVPRQRVVAADEEIDNLQRVNDERAVLTI